MEKNNLTIPNYQDQINFTDFLRIIKNYWKLILVFIVVNILASVIYTLSLPNIYQSSAELELVDSEKNQALSGASSQFGELGSLMGLDLGGNNESALVVAKINSRFFALKVANQKEVLPPLMAAKGYDHKTNQILYHQALYDPSKEKWLVNFTNQKIYNKFRSAVKVSFDQQTQLFRISVDHFSPKFAHDLLQIVIHELNAVARETAIEEAEEAINFLTDQLSMNTQANVLLAINSLIEAQLKTQMLANAQEDFLLKPIDPAFIPEVKFAPSRSKIVILWVLFSIIGVVIFLISKDTIWKKRDLSKQ